VLKLMSNISKGGERYTTVTSIRNTQEKLIWFLLDHK
jgi:ribosomal protein L33